MSKRGVVIGHKMMLRLRSVAGDSIVNGSLATIAQEPDDAYDAAQYFIDDVRDPWNEGDVIFSSTVRLICHYVNKYCFNSILRPESALIPVYTMLV